MDPLGGGVDAQCGHFLVKMYVKMKELGPIGGGMHLAHPSRSANDTVTGTNWKRYISNLSSSMQGRIGTLMLIFSKR